MPGDAHEFGRAVGVYFQQRFGLGDHPDYAAVVELQAITVAQADGLGKVEQDLVAGFRGKNDAAAMTAVEVDEDACRTSGPDQVPLTRTAAARRVTT